MKKLLLLFMIAFSACGTQSDIHGEWKAIRDYDYFHEEWRSARQDVSLILLKDGTYALRSGENEKTGTFTIDETASPYQIVLTDDRDGRVARGIYRVEGNKLTMRAADKPGMTEFPESFDPRDGKARLDLIEFERK